ncbi:hypothetical protein BKA70DRAFT_1435406 [Coprinopsis sp. MPI-PUGE-AT-0042]|nr:hypothetical protein BKA70DRAFT_1435406 [Coprinopsis sp. MPI-PUGE-AT-0042]
MDLRLKPTFSALIAKFTRQPAARVGLIRRAKQGVCESLVELASEITTQNYVLPALDAVLPYVQIEDIRSPDYNYHGYDQRLKRAVGAIGCITEVAKASKTPHRLKEPTVVRVLDHVEGILFWIQTLLINSETRQDKSHSSEANYCITFSMQIYKIVGLDPAIEAACFSSLTWIDIILRLWATEVVCFLQKHLDLQESAVVFLMWQTMQQPEGFLLLKENLAESPKQLRQFCADFVKRIRLSSNLLEASISIEVFKAEQELLRRIYGRLQDSPVIEEALLKHGCLRYRTLALSALSQHMGGYDVFLLSIMLKDSATASCQHVRAATQIVEGGFLATLFRGLHEDAGWALEAKMITIPQMLRYLGTMSCYPHFLKAFAPAIASLPEMASNVDDQEHPEVLDYWVSFLSLFRRRCTLYKRSLNLQRRAICDNIEHFEKEQDVLNHVKSCSGCDFVTYCSTICQREDWSNQHREEYSMNLVRKAFKLKHNVAYSQGSKYFQLLLIEDSFASLMEEYNTLMESHPSNLPPRSFIIILSSFEDPGQTLGIKLWDDWKDSRAPSECEALDHRADKLVEYFRGRSSTSMRLVEATFGW